MALLLLAGCSVLDKISISEANESVRSISAVLGVVLFILCDACKTKGLSSLDLTGIISSVFKVPLSFPADLRPFSMSCFTVCFEDSSSSSSLSTTDDTFRRLFRASQMQPNAMANTPTVIPVPTPISVIVEILLLAHDK